MKRANWTWRIPGVSKLPNESGQRRFRRFFTAPRAGYPLIVTAVAVLVLLGGIMAAESPSDAPAPGAAPLDPVVETAASQPLEQSVEPAPNDLQLRFGWWWLHNIGSPLKVGEWQGLQQTDPFWDVDTLRSNGDRTVDFTATGPESEATKANLYFYGSPRLSANLEFDRYLHRLDHLTPDGFQNGSFDPATGNFLPGSGLALPLPAGAQVDPNVANKAFYAQDINAGQDYAIRVQEFKANFKGKITEDLSWGLRTFGMEKQGMRQARYMSHCYTLNSSVVLAEGVNQVPNQPGGPRCHWLSQGQRIDWTTIEVEPYIAYQLTDNLRLEYSRTMRSFTQADQAVYRTTNGSGALPGTDENQLLPYAYVPDTTTDIDRVKIAADIGDYTNAYVLGYNGNNTNTFRDTNRHFFGVDARVANTAIDGLQVVGYGKTYQTQTSAPTQTLNEKLDSTQWGEPVLPDFAPVDRQYSAFGLTNRWNPFHDEYGTLRSRMTLLGGYEYSEIHRQGARYELDVLVPGTSPPVQTETVVFDQPTSHTNMFFVGVTEKWSRELQSTLKYRFASTQYPMFGVTTGQRDAPDNAPPGVNAINSGLPTEEDRIEITNTWQPVDNFLLNATVFIENSTHQSEFARFEEDRFPFMLSAWYAPSNQWSFSAGYAQLTDWIDQNVTLGNQGRFGAPGGPHADEFEPSASFTAPWSFRGKSDVMNLGATYAWTPRFSLTGGFEYASSINAIATPPSPPTTGPNALVNFDGSAVPFTPYTQLSQVSMVKVNTYRLTAGADYLWRPRSSVFGRYIYYNYDDITVGALSGESHMFLTGVSAMF